MPQFIAIPNTVQVAIRGTIDGEQCQNTLYFRSQVDPWTTPSMNTLASYLEDWWTVSARDWLPAQYQFIEIFVSDQSSINGFVVTRSAATPWSGLRATGGPMPNSTTFTISFRTSLRGRGNQGRNYWPGFVKNDVIGNEIALGAAEGIKDAYAELIDSGPAVPMPTVKWVVASRYLNKLPRPVGVTTQITEVTYRDRIVDSQRRRLPGRGM